MLDGSDYRVGKAPPQLECFRCGVCCTRHQPQLGTDEVATIAGGLGLAAADFLSRYGQLTNVGYLLRHNETGCVFLTWDGVRTACRIHAFRPEACRNWHPGLSRRECQAGLAKMKARREIMLPQELYPLPDAINRFYLTLTGG